MALNNTYPLATFKKDVDGVMEIKKKIYRIHYNRIEEFYIDIEAKNKQEARRKWKESDLQNEQETGNYNVVITKTKKLIKLLN